MTVFSERVAYLRTRDTRPRRWSFDAISLSTEHPVCNCFTSPVIQRSPEVCPLSRGANPEPLSAPLQIGFRFLRHPLPANPLASLTARCLCLNREIYRLTTFRVSAALDGLGSASSPGAHRLRQMSLEHLYLTPHLLVQASQHLWLVSCNDVYQRFNYFNHTTSSLLPTASMPAVATSPRGSVTCP